MPLSFLTDELPADHGAPEARHSATPNGRMETLPGEPSNRARLIENLPPPDTKRWVVRRKAAVVAAVRGGGITIEEASPLLPVVGGRVHRGTCAREARVSGSARRACSSIAHHVCAQSVARTSFAPVAASPALQQALRAHH
mgnify:CR=1 FL=1